MAFKTDFQPLSERCQRFPKTLLRLLLSLLLLLPLLLCLQATPRDMEPDLQLSLRSQIPSLHK